MHFDDAQLAQYRRDGYPSSCVVCLRPKKSPPSLPRPTRCYNRKELMAMSNLRVRWHYHYDTGEPIFELYDPVVDIAPRCDGFYRDPRVTERVAELLGDQVHPIKDKLIYKPAGAGGYPLHQDFIAWPGFPESFTTVVVGIDAATSENGHIELYPGAHARGCLAERDGNFHILPETSVAGFEKAALDLGPGDIAIFGAFMPHRSEGNRSPSSRRHLLFSYNADRDGGEQRREHYQAFHFYLRSIYSAMGLGDLYFR